MEYLELKGRSEASGASSGQKQTGQSWPVLSADLNVLWPLPQSGESWLLPPGKSRVMTWSSHQRPGVSQQTRVSVPALPLTSWITYTFPHLDIEGGG